MSRHPLSLPEHVFARHIAPQLEAANLVQAASTSSRMRAFVTPSIQARKTDRNRLSKAFEASVRRTARPVVAALVQAAQAIRAVHAQPQSVNGVIARMQRAGWSHTSIDDFFYGGQPLHLFSKVVTMNRKPYRVEGSVAIGFPPGHDEDLENCSLSVDIAQDVSVRDPYDVDNWAPMFRAHSIQRSRWVASAVYQMYGGGFHRTFAARDRFLAQTAGKLAAQAMGATLVHLDD